MRMVSLNALLPITLLLATIGCRNQDDSSLTDELEIYVSCLGRFQQGYSWDFSLSVDRKATLTVYKPEGKVQRSSMISPEQVQKLGKSISENRYFGLPEQIGKAVPDGGTTLLRVKKGRLQKSVSIMYFHEGETPDKELAMSKRAVRILREIRSLFEEPDAATGPVTSP